MEDAGGLYLASPRRQDQAGIAPVENMNKHFISLLCRYTPVAGREWATLRSIDGFTVYFQPFTHLAKALLMFRLDFAIRHRSDIEQKVGAVPRRLDHVLDQLLACFVIVVF